MEPRLRSRVGQLRDLHQQAAAAHRRGDHQDYERRAKEIYGYLREGWERGVEEVLLNGAVERFAPEVQTQRLRRLSAITDDHVNTLERGMSKTSRWLRGHDDAAALDEASSPAGRTRPRHRGSGGMAGRRHSSPRGTIGATAAADRATMILEKDGLPITTVEEWGRLAGPKRADQWKAGRSAYELARAWCHGGPSVPVELADLLDSNQTTRGATVTWGTPELRIHFDGAGGEPRNADLALLGKSHLGPVAITVEGKADEQFGNLVSDVLADAVDRGLRGRSHGVRRATELAASLLPPRGNEKASVLP